MDPMEDSGGDGGSLSYSERISNIVRDLKGDGVHLPGVSQLNVEQQAEKPKAPVSPPELQLHKELRKVPSIESISIDAQVKTKQPVWKIVLTGGPCGGKTTALSILADKLRLLGLQVFTVPENATMFSTSGAGFPVHSHTEHQLTWETSRMICQMQMEDSFENIAKASLQPTVILCDRGVIDARAYMDEQTWDKVLTHMGWEESQLRDSRYDMILHMVTTAVGARRCYVNTCYRHETPDQAAVLDQKISSAWKDHRRRCEVDNSTNYDEKVKRVLGILCSGLGIASSPSVTTTTFQLHPTSLKECDTTVLQPEHIHTIIVFLQNSTAGAYSFLRTRKQKGCFSFAHGRRTVECYTERHISQKEFLASLKLAHPQYNPVELEKRVWIDQNNTYELSHHDASPDHTYCTLKVETGGSAPITVDALPAWVRPHVVKDITNDPEWEEFQLARRHDAALL